MESIIERILIQLKANVPHVIHVKGGINYKKIGITFRYHPLPSDIEITVGFRTIAGIKASELFKLPKTGFAKYIASDAKLINFINIKSPATENTIFEMLELECISNIDFELSAEEPEVTFIK